MNARERADKLMDEKRLMKYPEHVRKIKRLRKQIRDLNRCIRHMKEDNVTVAKELALDLVDHLEREHEASRLLTFIRPRGTFLS
jgi:hypothetical protein